MARSPPASPTSTIASPDYIQDDADSIPQNIGLATTHGVEIDIKAKPIEQLELDVNYTNLTAENDSANVGLVRRPSNTTNFTATWTPLDPLTLSMGGSWIVGRQDFDPLSFQQVGAPNYFTLRASATYKINSYVTLWVRGENITNTQYQPVLGYPRSRCRGLRRNQGLVLKTIAMSRADSAATA